MNLTYETDLPYVFTYTPQMAPSNIHLALLLAGFEPPSEPFNWCELGCGKGLTTNLSAAAHPESRFYANDMDLAHVNVARDMAQQARLTNVEFYDDSFERFFDRDLPQFDYIALHGVLSWVPPTQRHLIARFVDRYLKPSGVLYVSFTCMGGEAAALPVRELMVQHVSQTTGATADRIKSAVDLACDLTALKKQFLPTPVLEKLETMLNRMREDSCDYLAHDYFVPTWQPLHFSQVHQMLSKGGFTRATSAKLMDWVDQRTMPTTLREKLQGIEDPLVYEAAWDYAVDRRFRQDLFVRDAERLSPEQINERILSQCFALRRHPSAATWMQSTSTGTIEFPEEKYRPPMDVLAAKGSRTVRELASDLKTRDMSVSELSKIMVVLSALDYAAPTLSSTDAAVRKSSCDGMNRALVDRAGRSNDIDVLVSPITGAGLAVSRVDKLFMLAIQQGKPPVEFVFNRLRGRDPQTCRAQPVEGDGVLRERLQEQFKQFDSRARPVFERLGVLPLSSGKAS